MKVDDKKRTDPNLQCTEAGWGTLCKVVCYSVYPNNPLSLTIETSKIHYVCSLLEHSDKGCYQAYSNVDTSHVVVSSLAHMHLPARTRTVKCVDLSLLYLLSVSTQKLNSARYLV